MTKLEILAELRALRDGCDQEDPNMIQAIRALDIAIETFYILADDYISRSEAITALAKEYNYRWSQEKDFGGLKMAWIEKAINSVPPVISEQKETYK